jgi:hypothetical protein
VKEFSLADWVHGLLMAQYGVVTPSSLMVAEAVMYALLSEAGDDAFLALNNGRTRRQLAAEQARLRAAVEAAP